MILDIPFEQIRTNKGERVRKSKLASLRRKTVRAIKKQKLEKVYTHQTEVFITAIQKFAFTCACYFGIHVHGCAVAK